MLTVAEKTAIPRAARAAIVVGMIALMLIIIAPLHSLATAAPDEAIAAADLRWTKRTDPKEADQLITMLEETDRESPMDAEVLWRLARAYWWKGCGLAKDDRKGRIEWFEKAKSAAKNGTEADPRNDNAFYWLASSIGETGTAKGILQSLFMAKPMREALERCIALNPDRADAHRVLAELYRQLPGPPLSIGNRQKALEEARTAMRLDSEPSAHQLTLARCLIAVKEYREAREILNTLLMMAPDIEDPQGALDDQAAARKELAAIAGK
ncbi:MAG: tetratricopeptide repeat protein [Clostridia bacterium]|nr:tetratricopeptide repeat protein [Clostridia bacterium]